MNVALAAVAGLGGAVAVLYLAHRCSDLPQRPAAAAVCGVAAVIAAAAVLSRSWVVLPIAVLGMAAAVVDVGEARLPDALTGPLAVATAVTLTTTGSVWTAVMTGGVALIAAVVIKAIHPSAVGWGDVKLVPSLAAALATAGPVTVYRGVALWAVLVLLTAGFCWAARTGAGEAGRDGVVPFGPALVAGTLGALLVT